LSDFLEQQVYYHTLPRVELDANPLFLPQLVKQGNVGTCGCLETSLIDDTYQGLSMDNGHWTSLDFRESFLKHALPVFWMALTLSLELRNTP